MFILFRKRNFSDYLSDTIGFFKKFGKDYFKSYLTINGGFILILIVLLYFVIKIYRDVIVSQIGNPNPDPTYISTYFSNNFFWVLPLFVLFVILGMFLSLLNVTFPVLYLQNYEKTGASHFPIPSIIEALKNNIYKMIRFMIGLLFIIMPLLIVTFVIVILLCFLLIGIPLLFIVIPASISWITLSYCQYIIKEVSFFTALRNGFSMLRQQFWSIVGTTLVSLFIIQTIQGIITLIPYIFSIAMVFTSGSNSSQVEKFESLGIVVSGLMIVSVLLSYFLNNFFIINQGLIFYSLREENENNSSNNLIDLIGTESE